jgi:hypothetical protein
VDLARQLQTVGERTYKRREDGVYSQTGRVTDGLVKQRHDGTLEDALASAGVAAVVSVETPLLDELPRRVAVARQIIEAFMRS